MIPPLATYLATDEAVTALRHAKQALAAVTDCLDPIFAALNEMRVPTDEESFNVSSSIVEQLAQAGNSVHAADTALLILLSLSAAFGGEGTSDG